MTELVKVRCLRHVYPDKTEVKLCGLDFIVKPGERVVILGPNGSGKTTLLAHIVGLLKPVEGEVRVLGFNPAKAMNKLWKRIGVVFQNVDEQIIGPTVWDDIAFVPRNHGMDSQVVAELVESIMDEISITGLKEKIPHYLSGGEKKKVALAGAMVMRPELLIMDEPLNGLDPKSRNEIINLLLKFNRDYGTTMIMTNHDVNLIPFVADSVYVINKGAILLHGTPRDIFCRLDILRKANLEPPLLAELFEELAGRGMGVDIPLTLEEAKAQLLKLLRKPTPAGGD